jgi:hypothetical protein
MGLYETKKLLQSKRNCHQTEEEAHRMGESFLVKHLELIMRIYRELKKSNSERINDPVETWGHKRNRNFLMEEV